MIFGYETSFAYLPNEGEFLLGNVYSVVNYTTPVVNYKIGSMSNQTMSL